MGWEKRGNNQYFYKKYRRNGKVISKYIGNPERIYLISLLESSYPNQETKANQDDLLKNQLKELRNLDNEVNKTEQMVKSILQAAYLTSGYHIHHRQWRRKNVKRNH